MQLSFVKMSVVSLLFCIVLQVNLSIAVPVFRDAASMAFAIQHQPELFRVEAAQPTGLRAETLIVPPVNSSFLLNLQYLSGLLNSLSTLLGQSPAPPATDESTPASGQADAPPSPPSPPSRAVSNLPTVGAALGQGRFIPSQVGQKTLLSMPGLGGLFEQGQGAIDFRGLPVAQLG